MPKLGMEPIRRAALIDATIAEIGESGSLDVTVSRIARRAGMSSGLAHHYFGGKDQMLLAAMRHTLKEYAREVRAGLVSVKNPRERLEAIVSAGFAPSNFQPHTVSAWLNFYVMALSSKQARRLHCIYSRRLQSNLRFALRPLAGARSDDIALRIAALIDGVYLHQGLRAGATDGDAAVALVMSQVDQDLSCFSG